MNDIISSMDITHKKAFVQLLDERMPKISEVWETCREDVNRSCLSSSYYCLSSYAFTGTINFSKPFPKTISHKNAQVQIGYIRTKVKNFCKNKQIHIVLYWELTPKNLQVHCHGVVHAYPIIIEKFKKWWARNFGYCLAKPLFDVDKWQEYCQKDMSMGLALPTVARPAGPPPTPWARGREEKA